MVTLTWPESHRSEFEIDRLLVTRALVGECFDYNRREENDEFDI